MPSTTTLPDCADYVETTRAALQVRLADAPAGELLCPYFQRGKMLRAFLVFAASTSVGGALDNVVMAAEAIELLHGASLIHDDIADQAALRRGLVSLHQQLGIGGALVVGDDLLLRAFAALGEARACHPPSRVLEAVDVLNQLARDCCRGQFNELCAGRWISEDAYLAIVRGKTGAPFAAAGVLGVLLGGGTAAQAAGIRSYAEDVGVAFQIGDDLLDLLAAPGMLGKPVGNSLALGRAMLPLIYLLETSDGGAGAQPSTLIPQDCSRRDLVALLEQAGIVDRARDVQRRYIARARETAEQFPFPSGVEALHALADRALSPSLLV
jgi:geranylgeranyl pyrophosphate synthase